MNNVFKADHNELEDMVSVEIMGFRKTPVNFHPCMDKHDAFEVVAEMRAEGFRFVLNDTGAQWRAAFVEIPDSLISQFLQPKQSITAWEDSLCVAICRSALLAWKKRKGQK